MFGVATYLVGTSNVDRLSDVVTKQGIILGWWQFTCKKKEHYDMGDELF
jgi:hypothetical protein